MSKPNTSKVSALLGVALGSLLGLATLPTMAEGKFSPYVDKKGNISLPKNFQTDMAFMGSWFVPAGDASGFHEVYTEKSTIEAYRKTGKFPDGATLVKELRASESGNYTTGANVSHATKKIKQWFVMVKDSKGRFPNNPLWGDGWGWALYQPGDKSKNVATNYKTDCLGCHIPAQKTDHIYIEAYPVLSKNSME